MVYLAIMPSDSLVSNVSRLIVTWSCCARH